jgi:hypothetical protein
VFQCYAAKSVEFRRMRIIFNMTSKNFQSGCQITTLIAGPKRVRDISRCAELSIRAVKSSSIILMLLLLILMLLLMLFRLLSWRLRHCESSEVKRVWEIERKRVWESERKRVWESERKIVWESERKKVRESERKRVWESERKRA